MNYTDDNYDALVEENTPFDEEALRDEYMSSHGNFNKIYNMATSENEVAFESLKEEMDWGSKMDLTFLIKNGCPYYKFFSVSASETKNLHLNKEIINFIYNYFESNNFWNTPTDYSRVTHAGENYLLHLMNRDRKNGKLTHDPETGYKATYNNISIHYGKLSYSPEELYAKLDSI